MPKTIRGQHTLSTAIESVHYDPIEEDLTIVFHERGTYVYHGVGADEWEGIEGATSRGEYFNLYIKGRYDYERVG